MASEGPFTPATFSDSDAVGTVAWSNPTNAGASDNSRAIADSGIGTATFLTVKIVKGGVVSGDNLAAGNAIETAEAYVSFGGEGNTGGVALTGADVKAADFGCVVQTTTLGGDSHYLKGLDVPFATIADATVVTGVLIEVEASRTVGANGDARVDHVRMTVYYADSGKPTHTMNFTRMRNNQ